MTNKVYKKIIKILKDKYVITFIIVVLIGFIKLPYYINGNGGMENLDKKVIIKDEYKSKGSINISYVSEYKANPYTILYAWLNKYEIVKKDVYLEDIDEESLEYRSKLSLKESLNNAAIVAYSKASKELNITKRDVYISYILSDADTDLLVGDKVLEVNGILVKEKSDVSKIINTLDDIVHFKVMRDGVEYEKYGKIKIEDDYKYVGIELKEDIEYITNPSIEFKFSKRESGPSGGLMLSLEIYNSLVSEDITKGYVIAGTGTIDSAGNVGSIGGVKYKMNGAKKAKVFFVPIDNYLEALEVYKNGKYKFELVPISTFSEALNYLNEL